MTKFEIIPGRLSHCGQIVRRLRHDYARAFLTLGINPHRELRTCFDASYLRNAWLINGKLEGLGGVFGGALSSAGYIWLALSQEATRYPVAMLKTARKQMEEIGATKHTLIASVFVHDHAAARFIARLGFLPSERFRVAPDAGGWVWQRRQVMREAA